MAADYRVEDSTTNLRVTEEIRVQIEPSLTIELRDVKLIDWPNGDRWVSVEGQHVRKDGEVGRHRRGMRPEWTAWECTPLRLVRARFEADAATLERAGYHVWTGVLNAEDFGVPQSRRRAVLIADRRRPVAPPVSLPRRSMADALGWDGAELVSNYGTGGDARRRGRRAMGLPAFTVTGKCGRNRWEWPDGSSRNLTVAEAGRLQTFRADYPWQGGSTSRQQQVGDAMPVDLAAAILRPLVATEGRCAA